MKTVVLTPVVALAAAAASSTALAGVFGAGNLLVSRYGDGTTTLSGSATAVAINEYTSAGNTSTLVINAGTNASTYGFVMFDTNQDGTMDLAYLADDRTTAGGGLQKWTLSGGAWTQSWALLVNSTGALSATAGTGFSGIRGLAGTWDAVNGARLYATTSETSNNRLISIADNGSTPTSATTLASAGTNYVFRGVAFTPAPAPGALALLAVAGLVGSRRRR